MFLSVTSFTFLVIVIEVLLISVTAFYFSKCRNKRNRTPLISAVIVAGLNMVTLGLILLLLATNILILAVPNSALISDSGIVLDTSNDIYIGRAIIYDTVLTYEQDKTLKIILTDTQQKLSPAGNLQYFNIDVVLQVSGPKNSKEALANYEFNGMDFFSSKIEYQLTFKKLYGQRFDNNENWLRNVAYNVQQQIDQHITLCETSGYSEVPADLLRDDILPPPGLHFQKIQYRCY